MSGYVSGVALPRIILKDFKKFKIVVPPLTLQNKFFEIVQPMMTSCYRLVKRNENLRQIRDLLLPKLISGELDVEHLESTTEDIAA